MYNFLKIKQEEVSSNIKSLPLDILNFNQESDFFIVVKLEDTPLSLDSKNSDSFYLNYIMLMGGISLKSSSKIEALIHIINGVLKSKLDIFPDTLNNSLVFRVKEDYKEKAEEDIRYVLKLTAAIIAITYTSKNWISNSQEELLTKDTYIDKDTAISTVRSIINEHPLLKYATGL